MPFSPQRKLKIESLFRDARYLSLDPTTTRPLLLTLLHYVDGHGRESASAPIMRELLYEFDRDVTPGVIDGWLIQLEDADWLLLYESGRRLYLQINPIAWKAFVSCDGRDGSRHPAPEPGPVETQSTTWGDLRDSDGPTAAEGKGEGEGPGAPPPWMLDPDLPPPLGCPKHPNNTGLVNCGACAGAREIHNRFMRQEISHEDAVRAWSEAGPSRARAEQ